MNLETKIKTIIVAIIYLSIVPMAFAQSSEEKHNLKVYKQWTDLWNEGHYDLMPQIVAATYIRHEPKGNRTVTRGEYLQEIKNYREKLNMRFVNLKISADKDLIWALWTVSTTDPKTGEKNQGRGVQLYRLKEGKLVETWWMGTIDQGAWPL
ncbi:nuclear transport factor 2 family protein [Thalassotalea psychrophila]|uniref:Nuclear transport factor 2 family protein n=1 Tax=Thalassotalea psychrophila TaxID=3065647 RepID=A0ABY9TTE6_9GAMM|nr:nuclear transport factor 2 family protein [Colwelliaceae bacterium SQ149]